MVEFGYRHPIPLSSCAPLFGSEEMVLFRAGGDGAITLPTRPPFVDVQTVTSLVATSPATVENVKTTGVIGSFSLPLKLVPTGSAPRRVAAAVIPLAEQDTLGRMLSVLPPAMLNRVHVAFTETTIYLYGPDAASVVPLGVLYEDLGDNVLVPLGWGLSPPIPPDVLRQLSRAPGDARLFVTGDRIPITSVPQSAFVPATRLLLGDVPVYEDAPIAPPLDGDRPLPDLWPSPPGVLAALMAPGARGELPPARTSPAQLDATNDPEQGGAAPGG